MTNHSNISTVSKRLLLFVVGFISFSFLYAENPNPAGAKTFVESYFSASNQNFVKGIAVQKAPAFQQRYQSKSDVNTPLFVFQQKENSFVMVAQSHNTFQIVGYSDKANFEPNNIPPQLQALMKFYEDSLQFVNMPELPLRAGTPVVAPLLDAYQVGLNQYNHPEVGGSYTGCMATAVSQILLYHSRRLGKPIVGHGSHCYTHWQYGELCADFESSNYTSAELLSYHVAIAMNMRFTTAGSSPPDYDGFYKIQDYFGCFMKDIVSDDYYIKNEVEHERPVYFEIVNREPGADGHALVIDGYDSNDYFHLNFGWGGACNGYYQMNTRWYWAVPNGMSALAFSDVIRNPVLISPTLLPVNKQDSLALVAIHNALGGTEFTGWDLSKSVWTWNGVLIFNERVRELSLYLSKPCTTSQSIAPEIGNLPELKKLYLSGCLNGNIPSSITNLTELEELNIHNREIYVAPTLHKGNIKAQLPANIGNLTKLERIDISNALEGNIPASIGNLTNLKMLDIYQDTVYFGKGSLSGNFPAEIGNLKKLQSLRIFSQQLTGTLPTTFNELPELSSLDLAGNKLSGTIPVLNSPHLQYLNLNDNEFSSLAEGTWNCPELITLHLQNNQISGNLPSGLCNLSGLKTLDVSNNQIETLPEGIGSWINIESVNLNNNKLKIIPDQASFWSKLNTFSASNNQIKYIGKDFGQFPELQTIDISCNQLTSIPDELGNCPDLYEIRLNSNKIDSIPASFTNLRNAVTVYLQNNEMQGKIPEKLITISYADYGRHIRLDTNRFVFSDIPKSEELKFGVRDQKNVRVNKSVFNVQIGDTVTLDATKLTRLSDTGNEYYWVEYPKHLANMFYDERMAGIENNPVKKIIIDEKTIKNKYYCKVFNPQSPSFTFDYGGSAVTSPCLYYLNTDTVSFRLASDEEIISENYNDGYVVSSDNIPQKIVSDQTVTLVPPLKVRGTLQWQASADGKTWYDLSSTMSQNDLKSNFVTVKQNELVLSPKTPAFYRCSVQDVNCEPLYSDTLKVNPFGNVLFDETVNVSQAAKTVSVDSIEVTLPAGLYDEDFRLTIVKLDNPPAAPDSVKAGSAYDVTVSFGETFDIPLLIKLKNFDKNKITDKDLDKFKAAYFDDKNHKWVTYENAYLSLKDSTLMFETNHLTKLSFWWDEEVMWGYTDVYQRNNIRVFYKETDVQTMNEKYAQTPQAWHISGIPMYIQDITQYLKEAMDAFKAKGLPVPQHVFTVYVKQMKDNDGVVGLMGMLNHYLTINRDIKTPVKLRSLLAHEFMHYTQDNYISANALNTFWMEAHAHLSDRMVWDDKIIDISESEHYLLDGRTATNSIYNALNNSWDYWDGAIRQNYNYCYLAGTFLHYMRSYRVGTKLDPATLLKETAWFGNWRNYLNSYIKTHLNSTIGNEYENYVKFILEGSSENFTILDRESQNPMSFLLSISREKKFTEKIVYDFKKDDIDAQTNNVSFKIPYLASKVYMMYNKSTNKDVVVKYKPLFENSENYRVYYGKYDISTQKVTYVDISDSTKYSMLLEARTEKSVKEFTNTAFLLFVNKKNPGSTDFSNDFDASFELTAMPVLNIENVAMLQMYNGSDIHPYTFDNSTTERVTLGNPTAQFLSSVTGLLVSSVGYNSTKKLLNDSTYKVENQYALVIDQGLIKGMLTMVDTTYYTQSIEYNFINGNINVTENSNKHYRLHPYFENPSGNLIQEGYLQHTIEETKTYQLKDIASYIQPETVASGYESAYGSNIQIFETSNTAETTKVTGKIQISYKKRNFDINGELTSSEVKNYQSTDYSYPNIIIRLIIRESSAN